MWHQPQPDSRQGVTLAPLQSRRRRPTRDDVAVCFPAPVDDASGTRPECVSVQSMDPTGRHPGFPARPLLRPGVRVCRREDDYLQLGLAAHLVVVAPDTAEIRALLADLRNGVPPGPASTLSPAMFRLCSDLLEKSLILDADAFLPALGTVRGAPARESLSAFLSDAGPDGRRLLAQRRNTTVQVTHQDSPRAGRRLTDLLNAGSVVTDAHDPSPRVAILVARGEPDRSLLDDWNRADVPHLVISTSEGVVRVGPFVVPGHTACLRCIDAHHTDRDPRRSLVMAQYAASKAPRDGLAEPIHHDLLEMALLWGSRDVLNWVDGLRPRSWSSTLTFNPDLNLLATPWSQHPGCGCGWGRGAHRTAM